MSSVEHLERITAAWRPKTETSPLAVPLLGRCARSRAFAPGDLMTALSDHDLSRGMAAGDVDSLSRVYDAYAVHIYSVALRMLRDPAAAEEVVFECFLRLWHQAADFDPERSPCAVT